MSAESTAPAITPAGLKVELFNDDIFRELRKVAQVPDDFVNTGWDLSTLKAGGGKGGTLMAFVGSSYIVKEMSKGDHQSLLRVASSYGKHVLGGDTLICPIYLHFRDIADDRFFFVMRNSVGRGPFKAFYDLKGCADDKLLEKDGDSIKAVHKRIWNVGMWCGQSGWSDARKRYFAGKVEARSIQVAMTQEQRDSFLLALERDTRWLAGHRLMDYSLLIAIKEGSRDNPTVADGHTSLALKPFTRRGPDGEDISIYVSIIDLLQTWTMGKKVARVIKTLERNKATIPPRMYADRFLHHFTSHTYAVKSDEAPTARSDASGLMSVAPPAGDSDVDAIPEEHLNVRPMPTDYANSVVKER
eukprot:TRINITY_DN12390_c0_g1_i1.p1 TRINITY_DN12390_c0_g1~~TRINITY_DN12390_c0_g1_i1.p1  ORF type:complete len:358 (-),score=60.37 TRINITY_DN12390_c0_g1_i1:205-1278(-)